MNITKTLFELSSKSGIGNLYEASNAAIELLSPYCEIERCDNLTVIGTIKGESDYTIMLDAHIDEVGFIVTNIDDNGFLTVAKSGGIDIRALPSKMVTVHGKKDIPAVFIATPPHLAKGEKEYDDITEIKLDTCLGSEAKQLVSIGDYVTYRQKPCELSGSIVTGKAFDDRAGVTCLVELAKRLSGKALPITVKLVLSDQEELGLRGSKTASFALNPDEAIAIDVSFGDAPDVSADDCGRLSDGAMIGISPVLCKNISDKLCSIAKQNNIPYQLEVMSGKTGTNSDVISLTREGIKTGLVSIPLRNMHTDCETLDIKDIGSLCDILEQYILLGGNKND